MPLLRSALQLRPKLVLGHPCLGRGGSELVVMWLIEALKLDFDVTVLTTGGWNLDSLNSFYGTHVDQSEVKVRVAPVPVPVRSLTASAFRWACYQRFAAEIAREYDVRISAYNLTDWGLPAFHFIADFGWNQEIRERFDPQSPGFIYQRSLLRRLYLRLAAAYESPTGRDPLRDDLIVANSNWTADLVEKQFGVKCAAVIYPPVTAEFPEVSWEQKGNAFVMIGRIAPEKRIEDAIAILDSVRQNGHNLQFHLCGNIDDSPYGRRIAHLCRERSEWIIPEGRVTGERKAQILANCRFGIQTRSAEPFGISIAEMVDAGAIVFAPNDGGQTEILQSSELLFTDKNDAVKKILAILRTPQLQSMVRNHLGEQRRRFSSRSFMESARKIIQISSASKVAEYVNLRSQAL